VLSGAAPRAEIGLTINWIRTHLEEDPQAGGSNPRPPIGDLFVKEYIAIFKDIYFYP
jgi:hypothetical protein